MNKQQITDAVIDHLLAQGQRSVRRVVTANHETCLYRNGDLKCAAGILIPEDAYCEKMEGNSWDTVVANFHSLLPQYLLDEDTVRLVSDLQELHDSYLDPSQIRYESVPEYIDDLVARHGVTFDAQKIDRLIAIYHNPA